MKESACKKGRVESESGGSVRTPTEGWGSEANALVSPVAHNSKDNVSPSFPQIRSMKEKEQKKPNYWGNNSS